MDEFAMWIGYGAMVIFAGVVVFAAIAAWMGIVD